MATNNILSAEDTEKIRQISFYDLFNQLDMCDTLGGPKSGWCKDQVRMKWIQDLIGPRIYPWANFRWDYKGYVEKNYDPADKVDKSGTMTAAMNNVDVIILQLNSLITDPNPGNDAIAGISDQPPSSHPLKNEFIDKYTDLSRQIIELKKDPAKNKDRLSQIRDTLSSYLQTRPVTAKEYGIAINSASRMLEEKPYDDVFFNRDMNKENSSNYYVQIGFCKTDDKDQINCESKKHTWTGTDCYKGKYVFMDNTPGLKQGYVRNMRGLIPSLVNDGLQMNPNAYMGLLSGYSVPGAIIQKCTEEEKMAKDAAEAAAAAGKQNADADADADEHFLFDGAGGSSGIMDNPFVFILALFVFICVFGGMYYFKVGLFQSID
jgi:hypothetical protein